MVSLVLATIVTLSLTYEGVRAADVELNDAGVWVSNEQSVLVGRLNHQVREIDALLAAESADIDLAQRADELLLINSSGSTVRRIDTAAVRFAGPPVTVPAGSEVALGDGTVGVLDDVDGSFWVLPPTDLAVIEDTTVPPTLSLGEGARMAIADDGTAHGVDVLDSRLLTLTRQARAEANAEDVPPEPEVVELDPEIDLAAASSVQTTVVGDAVVLLVYDEDDGTATLVRPGEASTDLTDLDVDLASARLQAPSATGTEVVVATSDALVLVPLRGGEPTVHTVAVSGAPAQPVQVRGCAHAAWQGSPASYLVVCGGEEPAEQTVPEASQQAELVFRVNRGHVVLNDLVSGDVWMLEERLYLVDNWELVSESSVAVETENPSTDEVHDDPLDRTAENRDPNAEPDDYGVRAGRTIVLPVLENDTDPDGDLLTVVDHSELPPGFGQLETIMDGRALQVRVTPEASGQASLEYRISDGREGFDQTTVRLSVIPESQNRPPEQIRDLSATVVRGQTTELFILDAVTDPDGDEVFLAGADQPADVDVQVTPDGRVTMRDLGLSTGVKLVTVHVSDGAGARSPIEIELEVLGDGPAPPRAVYDFASGFVGQDIRVEPLLNDIDPNGRPLMLTYTEPVDGGEIRPDYDNDAFTFRADTAGSYYVTYIVGDDDGLSAEGLVRVDVLAPTEEPPVAVRDTALLPPDGSVSVDVLANDSDPSGSVLAVQTIDVPAFGGLQVAVIDHRILRISSERALDGPVTIGYTVSNGSMTADGEVSVMPLPAASTLLPPAPTDDVARVRAGDHVTIPVLANDTHPNGTDFELAGLRDADEIPGLIFSTGEVVRYLAPEQPQTVEVIYEVVDAVGQRGSARVTIYVEARDEASNTPPEPRDIEVRAFAGEQIRIPVDLIGIDPDGDSVQLLGTGAPELGRVAATGLSHIDYHAFNDSTGTDTFTYLVRDRLGAIGTAVVTVGIVPPPDTNRSPVAVADDIVVRPDRPLQVDVLANDSDPDGDTVVFDPETPIIDAAGLDVAVEDGRLALSAPAEPGTWVIQYKITDTHGGTDIGALTMVVDPDADPLAPIATDDLVPASALLDVDTVEVDVRANDYDPDGAVEDLVVDIPDEGSGAVVLPDGQVVIAVPETRQIVTYRITDPDGEYTYGFVEVPGTSDTGPVLIADLEPIQVNSGETIQIAIADYVASLQGREVVLYDQGGVQATNSDGSSPVVDERTLTFTSAPGYAGPATLTFEVTDAEDLNSGGILTSVLTLPIEVIATTVQAPELRGGSLEIEPDGEEVTLDLGRLATDRDTPTNELTFSIGAVDGFDAELRDGVILAVTAPVDTVRGTVAELPISVTDGETEPAEATVALTATGSTQPLIRTVDDPLGEVHQGNSVTVDVLANDTNPFPGQPRTIVSAEPEAGVADVQISGQSLVITPGSDYVGRLSIVYTVQDATTDPDRWVQGRVTASVLGAPAQPRPPAVSSVGDRQVVLDLFAPVDNGSPITGYQVSAAGGSWSCATTTCVIDGLTNDVTYSFTVVAVNAVGESPPSGPSAEARPDVAPAAPGAPTVEFDDGALHVTWSPPANNGSPITDYDVRISPAPGGVGQQRVDGGTTSFTWAGLTNGQEYRFAVRALNSAPDPGDWGGWSRPERPSGPPMQPAQPSLTRVDSPAGGQLQARWSAPNDNGAPIQRYEITLYQDGSVFTQATMDGGASSRLFTVDNAHDYTVAVVAVNRSGASTASPPSASVRSFGQPGRTTGVSASPTGESGTATVRYTAPADNGQAISRYEYRLNSSGNGSSLPSNGRITGLTNGTTYTVQVRACNTYCGEWSAASAGFSTHAPPAQPSITSSADGRTVTFRWTAPASSNGASVTQSRYRINGGGWTTVNSRNGNASTTGNWEQNHTIEVQVQNQHGQWSTSASRSQRAGADPTPPVNLGVSRGSSLPCQNGGGTCNVIVMTYTNIPTFDGYRVTFSTSNEGGCLSHGRTYTNVRLSGSDSYATTAHYGTSCGGTTFNWTVTGNGQTYTGSGTW